MVPTLLLLDHNSTVQRVTKLAFKEEGVRVNAVQRGADAFAEIDAHPPDIIFTDNARKVVAFLKSRPKLPHIPVVLLKGAFDSSTPDADEALADDVLMKPLQPDAMIDCVKRLLSQSRNAAAPKVESLPPPRAESVETPLDLEQYFDQLSVAFNKADSTPSQLEGGLLFGGALSATAAGQTHVPIPRAALTRPTSTRPTPAAHAVSSELVEQVTQRVLDRLGERIVRSTATEVVSRLSKWLLVNEVERSRNTQ
jgi:CheY-like chemotaxis protein